MQFDKSVLPQLWQALVELDQLEGAIKADPDDLVRIVLPNVNIVQKNVRAAIADLNGGEASLELLDYFASNYPRETAVLESKSLNRVMAKLSDAALASLKQYVLGHGRMILEAALSEGLFGAQLDKGVTLAELRDIAARNKLNPDEVTGIMHYLANGDSGKRWLDSLYKVDSSPGVDYHDAVVFDAVKLTPVGKAVLAKA